MPDDSPAKSWQVGDTAVFSTVIDHDLIDRFADMSGDHNPLHVDESYAKKTAFGGCIAHGMIAGALFSRLVGEFLPGKLALYRSQDLRFINPLRPGTEVEVHGEVVSVDKNLATINLRTTLRSKKDQQLYVEGEAEVVLRQEIAAEEQPIPSQAAGSSIPLSYSLEGRRALVIGGSRGIGQSISTELAALGADLLVGYHSNEEAASALCNSITQGGGCAEPIALDLEDFAALKNTLATYDGEPIDILVHCGHGEIVSRGIERGSYDDLLRAFDRAVGGLYHATRALLPGMRKRGRGAIIAVSSSVTLEAPPPNWVAYTVAKSALVGLVRSLAVELGPDGIRANLVSPTLTATDKTLALPPRVRDDLSARAPLGRLATPEDVARAVAFLASDAASFLTGVDLPLSGGSIL